jgi:hypothetical protein
MPSSGLAGASGNGPRCASPCAMGPSVLVCVPPSSSALAAAGVNASGPALLCSGPGGTASSRSGSGAGGADRDELPFRPLAGAPSGTAMVSISTPGSPRTNTAAQRMQWRAIGGLAAPQRAHTSDQLGAALVGSPIVFPAISRAMRAARSSVSSSRADRWRDAGSSSMARITAASVAAVIVGLSWRSGGVASVPRRAGASVG